MRHTATVVIVAVTLVIVVLAGIGVVGAVPSACSACHADYSSTWEMSAHASVECYLCHQRPGTVGVLQQRTEMLVMVRSWAVPRPHEPPTVLDEHCVACHAGILEEVVENNAIRMRHIDVVEQGRTCISCHNTVTHGNAVSVPRTSIMDECTACHDGSHASDACETCHVPGKRRERPGIDTPWRITHGITWAYTHGLGDQRTCRTCHPQGYCIRCHGVDLPHPSSWGNTHGRFGRALPASCDSCHEQDLCTGCHSTDMPHPDDFLPVHSAEVLASGRDGCLGCHIDATCEACHEAHIHPGLTTEQIQLLGRMGDPR